jgi:putative ABC transport system permease protein
MNRLRRGFAKFRYLFTNARVEEDLEREIAAHLALLEDDFLRKGMAPDDARRAARRAYGGVEQAKQLHRDERSLLWLHHAWRSLRFGLRMLLKNPGLSLTILLTLALGVGANTAIFTVDYAVLLAPLPYPHPEQLVSVWTGRTPHRDYPSAKNVIDWSRQSQPFQDLSAFTGTTFDIASIDLPENVWGMRVTSNYYRTLGSSFFLGRDFLHDEDQEGRNHVVILTHKLWNHLGGDPKMVGRTLRVNGEPYTVVGVLQPGIADRDLFQLAVPLVFTPEELHQDDGSFVVVGRLKPGVNIAQAQDNLDAVATHLAQHDANSTLAKGASVRPLREYMFSMSSDMKQTLWLLLGAVGFVLLIACVNVANLLLAKGMARQKEIAIRSALGATRKAIFAQMLTENLLLAVAGGVFGIGLGYAMLRILLAAMPRFTLPWATDTRLNLPVLLFTLSATTLAGLLFGCAPAWYASRTEPSEALKSGGHAGLTVGRHRLQQLLVIGELALALSLIAGAGLAIHSFVNLMRVDTGVRTDHVLTFYLGIPKTQPKGSEKIIAFYKQMLSSMKSVPGVASASAQTTTPLFPMGPTPFTVVGESTSGRDSLTGSKAGLRTITPEYFKTFGIRLMKGRAFNDQDLASSVKVAMVNEDFVRTYLKGNDDPLRQRILIQQSKLGEAPNAPSTAWQIVGVYHNVRSRSMREHPPEMQIPFWQAPSSGPVIAVRTSEDPDSMIKSIATAVHSVDPAVTMAQPRTMEQIRTQVLSDDRFSMILFVSFGSIALLLAALGVYGVMSFSVAGRRREIALRMAVGADRASVVAGVLKEGVWLSCVGLGIGLFGAYFVGRGMRSTLFGVGAIDLRMLGAVIFLLTMAALLACLLPARRAASVEPMQVLRTD